MPKYAALSTARTHTKNIKSFRSHVGPQGSADLRFCSLQPDTSLKCETSASHCVPVYIPAYTSTKLYCIVTEKHECEQLAQSRYTAAP